MAVPAHLNSSFSFREMLAVTDVADVIVAIRDELLNQQSPAWTEPVSGTFKSPPDANGRFVEFDISASSTTRIAFVVRDDTGAQVIDQTADMAAVDRVYIYSGQFYLQVEFMHHGSGAPECFGCGITDISPEATDSQPTNVWAHGRRNNAGTLDAAMDAWSEYAMFDDTTVGKIRRAVNMTNAANAGLTFRTQSGMQIVFPVNLTRDPRTDPTAEPWFCGRLHQAILVDDFRAAGEEIVVPIDDALTGVFRVSGRTSDNGCKMAWRSA